MSQVLSLWRSVRAERESSCSKQYTWSASSIHCRRAAPQSLSELVRHLVVGEAARAVTVDPDLQDSLHAGLHCLESAKSAAAVARRARAVGQARDA
eukprot:scaffold1144_cov37-Phaeocystis_antarctica.AAC.1